MKKLILFMGILAAMISCSNETDEFVESTPLPSADDFQWGYVNYDLTMVNMTGREAILSFNLGHVQFGGDGWIANPIMEGVYPPYHNLWGSFHFFENGSKFFEIYNTMPYEFNKRSVKFARLKFTDIGELDAADYYYDVIAVITDSNGIILGGNSYYQKGTVHDLVLDLEMEGSYANWFKIDVTITAFE